MFIAEILQNDICSLRPVVDCDVVASYLHHSLIGFVLHPSALFLRHCREEDAKPPPQMR